MELGGTDAVNDGGAANAAASATSASTPFSPAWETYYRQASRRRRASGGGRQLREEKRRRRIRERLGLGLSAMLVLGLTTIFYFVLTR